MIHLKRVRLMFKFLKDKSIMNRIIIINAVVSVCIIMFLVFNNFYIKDELNKRTFYNYKTLLAEFQNKFFVETSRMKNASTLILAENEITNVKQLPKNSAVQVESMRSLKNKCLFISAFFDYSSSMNIHIKEKNIIISKNGNIDGQYFDITSDGSPSFNSAPKINFEKLDTGFYTIDGYIFYVDNTMKDAGAYFVAAKDAFISFLDSSGKSGEGGFAIYLDGELLAQSKNIPVTPEYEKLNTDKHIYKSSDGRKYGITTADKELCGKPLTFAYVSAYNQYEKIAGYVNLYTWLSIFLFLFINIGAVFGQYLTYMPIKKMASGFDSFENGKNEIHSIQNAVEHLKKDNAVMQDVIMRNERIYEGQALLKLMLGEKQGIDGGMISTLSEKFCTYVVLYMLPSDNFSGIGAIEEALFENYYIERIFTDTKSKKYVVCCDDVGALRELLIKTVKNLNAENDIIIGMSDKYSDITSLNTAYAESTQVVYKCTAAELLKNNVLIYKNSEFKSAYVIPWEKEHGIINAVLGGDAEKTDVFFDGFLYGKLTAMSYENFKRVYSHLISILKGVIDTNRLDITVEGFDRDVSIGKIHEYVKDCYQRTAECFKYTTKSMYDLILEYINENIDKCLSVNSVAYSLKITPEYLSAYFKKTSGLNISTYINNAKMEKAKEILRSKKNVKISDVAEMVGIDQVNTFNRKFKKYTGETPSSFRQKID